MLDTQFNGSTSEIGRDFMKVFENYHNMINAFARMKKANAQTTVRSSKTMTCPECQSRIKLARCGVKKHYTSQHPELPLPDPKGEQSTWKHPASNLTNPQKKRKSVNKGNVVVHATKEL